MRFVVVPRWFISSKSLAPPSGAYFVASSANPIFGPAAAPPANDRQTSRQKNATAVFSMRRAPWKNGSAGDFYHRQSPAAA